MENLWRMEEYVICLQQEKLRQAERERLIRQCQRHNQRGGMHWLRNLLVLSLVLVQSSGRATF